MGGGDLHALDLGHQLLAHVGVGRLLLAAHLRHQGGEGHRRQVFQHLGLLEADARVQRLVGLLERAGLGHPLVLGDLVHELTAERGEVVGDLLRPQQLGQPPHVGGLLGAGRAGHQPHPVGGAHQFGEGLVSAALRIADLAGLVVDPQVDVGALGQLVGDDVQAVVVDDVKVGILGQQLLATLGRAGQHHSLAATQEVAVDLVQPHAGHRGLGADDDRLGGPAGAHQVVRCPQCG
ncbi:hypothetical protein D3C85_668740 [compost metagenome]